MHIETYTKIIEAAGGDLFETWKNAGEFKQSTTCQLIS
jgi:hypothetical protein